MRSLGKPPFVYLITKGETTADNYSSERERILEMIAEAASDGVSVIQIREKSLPARLLFDLVSEVVKIAASTKTIVIVNDRVDVALAAGADGVHLPENSLNPSVVRRVTPKNFFIGASVHAFGSAKQAASDGADYVLFAPVFETPGKGAPTGVDELKRVCDALPEFPVIALGGIDDSNVTDALDAGASGIAAIRSLHDRDSRRRIISRIS